MNGCWAVGTTAFFCALYFASPLFGEGWTRTSAPTNDWCSIASSADGSLLVAVYNADVEDGDIYTSTNFGLTWRSNNLPGDWWSVACSADGTNVFATEGNGGRIAITTNAGMTWTLTSPESKVECWSEGISASGDGKTLLLGGDRSISTDSSGTNQLLLYISTDAGTTWTGSLTNAQWDHGTNFSFISGVAVSADASVLLAVTQSGDVYSGLMLLSTNGGMSFLTNAISSQVPHSVFHGVACSSDGRIILACRHSPWSPLPGIYVSTNTGNSWLRTNISGVMSVACSADGTKLAAVDYNGHAFRSSDTGATWIQEEPGAGTFLVGVASSADGCKLVAVVHGGGISTWQTTPDPVLNIASSSANLLLSWIVPSQPFLLEESPDLTNWSAVGLAPTLNYTNLHNELSLPVPPSTRFYRLAMQH